MNPVLIAFRQDLQRVAREDGLPPGVAPSPRSYSRSGRYQRTADRVMARHGWRHGMARLGLRNCRNQALPPSRAAALEDIQRVAREVGHPPGTMPTEREYRRLGDYTAYLVAKVVGADDGRWSSVALLAGLAPTRRSRATTLQYPTPGCLLDDIRRVGAELGYTPGGQGPTQREFQASGRYPHSWAREAFGSWNGYLEAAGYTVRRPKGGWARIHRQAGDAELARLADDYRRLSTRAGYPPPGPGLSKAEWARLPDRPWSDWVCRRVAGTWMAVVQAAGYHVIPHGGRAAWRKGVGS